MREIKKVRISRGEKFLIITDDREKEAKRATGEDIATEVLTGRARAGALSQEEKLLMKLTEQLERLAHGFPSL